MRSQPSLVPAARFLFSGRTPFLLLGCATFLFLGCASFLFLGCAQEPVELSKVRLEYDRLAAEAAVRQRAGVELYQAEGAVKRAEATWKEDGNYDEAVHQAYLASRKLELTGLAASRRAMEEEVAKMPRRRASQLLAARDHGAASMRRVDVRIRVSPDRQGELERILERLSDSPDERGVVTLGDVNFDFDSAVLRSSAESSLDILAEFLATNTGRSVLVEGHTDDVGVLEYNFDLSRRRAEHVKSGLLADGVDPERVLAVGYGPIYPLASNATPSGRAQNRRVEVVVLGRGESLD